MGNKGHNRGMVIGMVFFFLLLSNFLLFTPLATPSDQLVDGIHVPTEESETRGCGSDPGRETHTSSTETGTETVLVNNTYYYPSFTNGTFDISINVPQGYGYTLTLSATSMETQNHVYVGFPQNGTADGWKYIAPGEASQAIWERVELNHSVRPVGVWGRIRTTDNVTIDDDSRSYHVEMRDANVTDYPDEIVIDESYDFTTNQLTYAWNYFGFTSVVNITTPGSYWIGFNASNLNYTTPGGQGSSDHMESPFMNEPGETSQVAQWDPATGCTFLDDRHMPFRLLGHRIGADNETWESPGTESINLTATIGGEMTSFSGNTTGTNEPVGESGAVTISVLLGSNMSTLVNVSWEVEYTRGKDRSVPEPSYPEGRYPDHMDHTPWVESPWEYDLMGDHGWFVFFLGIYLAIIMFLMIRGAGLPLLYVMGALACTVLVWWVLWQVAPGILASSVAFLDRELSFLVELREFLAGIPGLVT